MEQKAVVYKNIKGMSRDMSVSNGNNEYSYENYNVRITTRGNEDSFVLTNEKGTESSIIAGKNIIKVVNALFIGKQPDFYNHFSEINLYDLSKYNYNDLYKKPTTGGQSQEYDINDYILISEEEYSNGGYYDNYIRPSVQPVSLVGIYYINNGVYTQITQEQYDDTSIDLYFINTTFYTLTTNNSKTILSSSNDDIVYCANTEYPIGDSNGNELKIKGSFNIVETPTEYLNEKLYLLNNGSYSVSDEITIPSNSNTGFKRHLLKDIVLGGSGGYYKGSEEYDDINGINNNYPTLTDDIKGNWISSYKYLYDKLTERKFDLYGFNTNINRYVSMPVSYIPNVKQNITTDEKVFSSGRFENDNFYVSGNLSEENITIGGDNNFYRLKTASDRFGFLNGFVLADKYPTGFSISFSSMQTYELRLPIFKTIDEWDDTSEAFVYNAHHGEFMGRMKNIYSTAMARLNVGYIKIKFTFDVSSYLTGEKYKKQSIDFLYSDIVLFDSSDNVIKEKYFDGTPLISVSLEYDDYPINNNKSYIPVFGISVKSNSSTSTKDLYGGINEKIGTHTYTIFDYAGPLFNYNLKTSNFVVGDETKTSLGVNDVPNLEVGSIVQFVKSGGNTIETVTDNNVFPGSTGITTTDNVVFTYNSQQYNCNSFSLTSTNTQTSSIDSIESVIDNNIKKIKISLSNNTIIYFNPLNGVLTCGGYDYIMYRIASNEFSVPFIAFVRYTDDDSTIEKTTNIGYSNGKTVYVFNTNSFVALGSLSSFSMIDSDNTIKKVPCNGSSFKIFKLDDNVIRFGSSDSVYMNAAQVTRLSTLPIFNSGTGNTDIRSRYKKLYVNPTYDVILRDFGFSQDKFTPSIATDGFRLKYSNNDWDNKFKYVLLDNVDDNEDYIKNIKPMYGLDTNVLKLVTNDDNGIITSLSIDYKQHDSDDKYFGNLSFGTSDVYVTVKDKEDFNFSLKRTLAEFINGISSSDINLSGNFSNKHDFYISEINTYNNEPAGLVESNIEQDIQVEEIDDPVNMDISYSTMKDNYNNKYIRQTITNNGWVTTCTSQYSFNSSDYMNEFFSTQDLTILITNYDNENYQSLAIPGRILGSCTIEEYVVLFFHYSSPALKFYQKVGNNYNLVTTNTDNINELYTKRHKARNKFDLAVKNGELLKDDNNDYINGKNRDYIIKLKYINAKPDNKENIYYTIVKQIANAATQQHLVTPIIEKKPYYSADILWSGNLNFNSNYGIETIGYYESKDVIKVYFTDGFNQPRMINIMTPVSQREGVHNKWDNKTFDFIQEISGKEQYTVTKKYGGGAFPAGTIQYFFTYSNLGGCETNPFISTPIYYTSEEDTGNSKLKVTDNCFDITITNLSKRFNYVNVYSVLRTSKNMQPYCKRVISLSMKNNKSYVQFVDNNLLGETVDSSYLLMLQGTPITALTFAEKDNTLFLGNINKMQHSLTPEEKEEIKLCIDVNQTTKLYQSYNPNEEEWYENKITNSSMSLGLDSRHIKTFMYNEYYRLGLQMQDKFGKWSDPIFIRDVKCETTIANRITYSESQDNDGTKSVSNLSSYFPYFYLKVKDNSRKRLKEIMDKYGYIRVRPMIVYPDISSRNVLCQGLLNPTMFNYADRSVNGPFNFSSYFFRPYPPAISSEKNEDGKYKYDVDLNVSYGGGYPVEYRHGYPITGYHDIVEESLAIGGTISGIEDLKTQISNYLSKTNLKSVKITSNTPGWWCSGATYIREGVIEINQSGILTFKKGCKVFNVSHSTNRGHLKNAYTFDSDKDFVAPIGATSSDKFKDFVAQLNDGTIYNGTGFNTKNSYSNAIGFSSHMHYFKNKLLNLGAVFLSADIITTAFVIADAAATGSEVIKKISDTEFCFNDDCIIFNEGNITYFAYYPLTIKVVPLSKIKRRKHRGLKRKTYYCDFTVEAERIEVKATNENSSKYIDDADKEADIAKKAYFSLNNGEIQCANGNKDYNIYKGSVIDSVDLTYSSSEINVAGRKQSLFYVDESVCTLNSPEIEFDSVIQKIDLSNYKLNIVGAANITGYKNNINIDYETPPSVLGSIVCEGFRHEPFEMQNFNSDAYRYMLSGGYWYDAYFQNSGDDEGEKYVDDSKLISDQYCWWVYPFNRAILNNSHEGVYGKCRTKKWVNYHYSAFSDYFGNSSISYNLADAKQIYSEHQSVNLKTIWQSDEAMYFGSCDTAYVNPVPLVGILGGSNNPDENAYEQSLAVSPHCKFKAGNDTYTSANLADIVPFTFASSNHFVLSLEGYGVKNANVFPKYYRDDDVLESVKDVLNKNSSDVNYQFDYNGNSYYLFSNPKTRISDSQEWYVFDWFKDENGIYDLLSGNTISYSKNIGSNNIEFEIKINNVEIISGNVNDIVIVGKNEPCGIIDVEGTNVCYFRRNTKNNELYYDEGDFETVGNNLIRTRKYNIPNSLISDPEKPDSCSEIYVHYDTEDSANVKNSGIYDYGHIYIAQLERGVTSADQVFSGTEESVLMKNTWIPAGNEVSTQNFLYGIVSYTEGDTYYQRYDCMKTYAHSASDVNQNIEFLSSMIQTRINIDGIYSVRGSTDNIDANLTNTNLLNDAYTQDNNYFIYTITDSYISDITEYSNMFTWTLTKNPMSRTDAWLAINLISFYNATGSFGKITRLINYRNNIFCFQNNAISKILYNERIALTPSDGVPIEIGNSGKVQGLSYISSNVGCQNRWSVMPSKSFLYWVDDRRAEIYRFGEGLEPFSTTKGFSDWVKDNTYGEDWKPIKSTNVPITTYYDNNNDDIYFITEKDCLAYNEKIDAFESFFSYEDSFILNSAGNTIVIKEQDTVIKDNSDYYSGDSYWNNGIKGDGLSSIELMHEGEYNKFFGVQMPFYVRFKIYPNDMQRDKIYTNLEFNADAFDEKDIYIEDDTFTRVRVWNEYQFGQWVFNDQSNLYGTTIYKRRFRTQYLQLPRASYYPNDRYNNFGSMFYRDRMWSKISGFNGNLPSYITSNSVNDRIRNPWSWVELYKSNGDENDFNIDNTVTIDNYLNKKNDLFIRKFIQVGIDNFSNYDKLYKNYIEYTRPETQPSSLEGIYLLNSNNEFVQITQTDYDNTEITLYVIDRGYTTDTINHFVAENEDGSDRNPIPTQINNAELSSYSYSQLYYYYDNKYVNISSDMYDDFIKNGYDGQLYILKYNNLYELRYLNCANILTFDNEIQYYTLVKSNSRVEIHDIIVKYFEA